MSLRIPGDAEGETMTEPLDGPDHLERITELTMGLAVAADDEELVDPGIGQALQHRGEVALIPDQAGGDVWDHPEVCPSQLDGQVDGDVDSSPRRRGDRDRGFPRDCLRSGEGRGRGDQLVATREQRLGY